jgi:hypothetical protein
MTEVSFVVASSMSHLRAASSNASAPAQRPASHSLNARADRAQEGSADDAEVIASSLKFRRLIVAVAAGLLAFGVLAPSHARRPAPEFGPTMVEVRTGRLACFASRSNS